MHLNFTLQDTLGMALAVLIFPTVWVFPGYAIGWIWNLFSFKQRTGLAQYVIAIALSNALIPIILFLAFRFVSNQFGIGIIIAFFLSWVMIQIKLIREHGVNPEPTQVHKIAFSILSLWIVFCLILLVDIQLGPSLYINAASHDFTTRTALIDAITRTGIPPVNPTYYPGHFERITELYYFWYILGSVVDSLGGSWVDARMALFAGITWSGLALMATIATYLRMRNPEGGISSWRASTLGLKLLAVSGLDLIPVISMMIAVKTTYGNLPFDGRIEGWNMVIMSWLNALTWVPNHVTSMAACIIAMLAILASSHASGRQWLIYVALAGASIGSAFGLSIWVTFTFGVFMAIWGVSLLFQRNGRSMLLAIVIAGLLGLVMAFPFLIGVLQAGGKSEITGALPVGLYVRPFSFSQALPPGIREIVSVILLPINYFFELGFFFVIAILWIIQRRKSEDWQNNPFGRAELLLLATVAILLSFVKSTVIALNDLGMRGWLLGQFVLIIWSVDILMAAVKEPSWSVLTLVRSISNSKRIRDLALLLLIVGILTTSLEATSTRFWTILVDAGVAGVPSEFSPDMNLGKRTYDARLAYEYIREHTSKDIIIQNNPTYVLDRPSGLYGTRQMVIGDRTAYGVPSEVFRKMSAEIGQIFLERSIKNWNSTDEVCRQYGIQLLVVGDTDPLWSSLPTLQEQRPPLYSNLHYAVFPCGSQK